VLSHVLSGWLVPVHIIAVEKREPFRTGVWLVGPRLLKVARTENERAIARMAECHDNDVWPTGYEDVRLME
jgi:hypothetical protein